MEEEKTMELEPERAEELFMGGWEETGLGEEAETEPEAPEGEENEDFEEAEEPTGLEEPDFSGFIAEHPELSAEDIPEEVWDRVAKGESLSSAWTRHENALLKKRLLTLEQQEINRARSTLSRKSGGRAKAYDPFEDGWNM